ncbi:TetR/AcrR family transcriptional regulator [Paenibacillus sp. CF384]|uniref:TetR/AcrR family transcriptional regulator n=1 Tax=Paenibacillus sp. CF384 TaxID=1884382 RepID=UPI00089CB661|nr:TetR/AcrR family transcriptional regulator [Paenibacillus sp. CF384]SDX67820.1 transcriptional regulator, TetR family [Paenibacillus sp. CF384]
MTTRRQQLTEEMKAAIRSAAAALFAEKGYSAVTMREIAKAAGCSHTAIYLYFRNKEELLQQIAIPSLLTLEQKLLDEISKPDTAARDKLLAVCSEYVLFSLTSGSLQTVLFMSASVRVDELQPELEVNVIRNRLFAHIMKVLHTAVSERSEEVTQEAALNNGRILFYYLQGFISTYSNHSEPTDELLARTLPIFKQGIHTLIRGMHSH